MTTDDPTTKTELNEQYSQTCIRRPLLGPLKGGRLGKVVVL